MTTSSAHKRTNQKEKKRGRKIELEIKKMTAGIAFKILSCCKRDTHHYME